MALYSREHVEFRVLYTSVDIFGHVMNLILATSDVFDDSMSVTSFKKFKEKLFNGN